MQLIYAFNGTGKTRLSQEFKQLIAPKNENEENKDAEQPELSRTKILYYNAFTEDLFYWDNDLTQDAEPTPQEKQTVRFLLDNLIKNYGYWQQDKPFTEAAPQGN